MENEFYTLITGASKGIGRAIAIEMASRGHNLILHSLPGEGLEKSGQELKETYKIKVKTFEIDLTEKDGPVSLYNAVKENGLKLNILINNAGIGIEGPFETCSNEFIDHIIFLNIRALTLITSLFTPDLKKTKSYILNVSSFGIYAPTPYKCIYLASKSYIFYFTRALHAEFKGTSVKTCIFVPAAVSTNSRVMKRIEEAGWISKMTVVTPEKLASEGIAAMFRGRSVHIPGRFTRLIFVLSLFIPEGIIIAVTRSIFRREYSI